MNNNKSGNGPGVNEALTGAKRWALLDGLAKDSSQEVRPATKLSHSLEEGDGSTAPLAENAGVSNQRTDTILGAVKGQVGTPPLREPVETVSPNPTAPQSAQSFGHLFRQTPTSPSEHVPESNHTPLKALLKHIAS